MTGAPQNLESRVSAMEHIAVTDLLWPVQAGVSLFQSGAGASEAQIALCPSQPAPFGAQLAWLEAAYAAVLESLGIPKESAVFRRLSCSDLANQAAILQESPLSSRDKPDTPCAISWVGQPPPPPARVTLWAYHIVDQDGLSKSGRPDRLAVTRGPLTHHWATGAACLDRAGSYAQTAAVLDRYLDGLTRGGMTLEANAVRTWFFLQNVDADYPGLVTARRERFAEQGLTHDTHYIASTGIQGQPADASALLAMDAYAVAGLRREQVTYLAAPDHLCPTHRYGVTFERATAVDYRDRRHIYLSGTASIDAEGRIVHPGDVHRQLQRMLENAGALLAAGGATLDDLGSLITYVRDPADQHAVADAMAERFGRGRGLVLVAPVCRPGWLVEVEGLAVVRADNRDLPSF